MEQDFEMTSEAELIWDELELGERIEIFRQVMPGKSTERTMNRVFRHIENNIEKYRDRFGY